MHPRLVSNSLYSQDDLELQMLGINLKLCVSEQARYYLSCTPNQLLTTSLLSAHICESLDLNPAQTWVLLFRLEQPLWVLTL